VTLVGLIVVAIVAYLAMRRRGRVFLESEEGFIVGAFALLAIVQRLALGNVSLSDHFVTPLYFALPVVSGYSRGPARGLTAAVLGGAVISAIAIAFAEPVPGETLAGFPGQHLVLIVALGLTGAGAGLRTLPKALKPLLASTWLLLAAAYHPEYARSLSAYVTLFASITLASLGLYLNLVHPPAVSTIHYPTSPSRRA